MDEVDDMRQFDSLMEDESDTVTLMWDFKDMLSFYGSLQASWWLPATARREPRRHEGC